MKTLYVGGKHFLNRFSNLEAAVERAQDDDIIELHKDVHDVAVYINKNITINGHGHIITPADGKAAFDCSSFVTMNSIRFECKSRTNAVILRKGGNLTCIQTRIIGPARALYPTIVQRGGAVSIVDSNIMYMETYKGHGKMTYISLNNCHISDYYGGSVYLTDDSNLSKFRSITRIYDSVVECALFENNCKMIHTTLRNFNKVTGTMEMYSCELTARKLVDVDHSKEPADGPLCNWNPDVIPYSLHIAGGKAVVEDLTTGVDDDSIGFYMTSGLLDIRMTDNHDNNARHLIKGGSVIFNNVTDNSFYEIKKARCSIKGGNVNVNMSKDVKSAMDELDSMIGLQSVKSQIRTIMNTAHMNMEHPEKDFGFSNHMIFAGDPGTGKTVVARLVAKALFEIGAIPEDKCIEVSASQMVKGFVGQTGEHAESILKKALGGVLFIDEAYELMVKDGQNTFNNDVLEVLLRYMEDHRDELVVIAAGYEKEMREFLASNPGLTRRFQWVSFENYTPQEMASIFLSMAERYKEEFDDTQFIVDVYTCLTYCFTSLTEFYLSHPDAKGHVTNGGNGGLVRNLFQQVIFARNDRVAQHPETTIKIIYDDLKKGFNKEFDKAANVR